MPPKSHANLGASKSERWMNCPGSVAAEAGLPDVSSPYALEGTAAHALAERALHKGLDADVWLETEIHGVTVTEEMANAVQVFLDHVRTLVQYEDDKLLIEHEFDLSELNPPGPMYGTGDAVVWSPRRRTLYVCDYKHGRGVAVDATENSQLGYYALGAVISLKKRPDVVVMTIVQPRAFHPSGIVRSTEMSFGDLVSFKRDLWKAAEATLAPDAPKVVGDWCRFCKAMATCPAQRAHALTVVEAEFDLEPPPALPAPELLDEGAIQRVLAGAGLVRDWLSSIERHVTGILEAGGSFPGYKLVPKRATRKWADGVTEETLHEALGLKSDDLYVRKLVSPAQAEGKIKELYPAGVRPPLPEGLVVKESSGYNLAPEQDPRPAVGPGAVGFALEDAPPAATPSVPSVPSKPRRPRKKS